MKKVILNIDENYGDELFLGFIGNKGKNIKACVVTLEHENEFKVRADGEMTDLRKLEGNDEWDN